MKTPAAPSSTLKYAWIGVLYFAEGLPFGLLNEAIPVSFRQAGVSLQEIGLLSIIGLPWTFKFLWSPAVDRLGKRRSWFAGCQVALALLLFGLSTASPGSISPLVWAALCLMAVASATQDIAVDAFSIEMLDAHEIGTANGIRVTAYRVAMILSGGALVGLSAAWGWPWVWRAAGIFMLGLAVLSQFAPPSEARPAPGTPLWEPLARFFRRPGAAAVAVFILTFKAGDYAMAPMTKPFLVDGGFSAPEIGVMVGTFGVGATIAGALLGGALTSRWGVFQALWILGLFQAVSNLGYAGAAAAGGRPLIWSAALFEAFSGGLGTAAFLGFLMASCEKEHAATQYALLTALFGLCRSVAGAVSGYAASKMGYAPYFALTFLVALPAFGLLPWARRWLESGAESPAPKPAAA